jgi:hypothetical protein
MRRYASDVAFTPAVKAIQVAKDSRAAYAQMEWGSGWETAVTPEVEAWDMNCPKHIHRRFSERAVAPVVEQLQGRIKELEAEVAGLRLRLDEPVTRE